MKSTLNFDRMPTLNQNTVTSFTLLALINYVFATLLRKEARIEALKKCHSGADSSSIQRAAKLFSNVADTKNLTETLLPLLSDMLDPNYKSMDFWDDENGIR